MAKRKLKPEVVKKSPNIESLDALLEDTLEITKELPHVEESLVDTPVTVVDIPASDVKETVTDVEDTPVGVSATYWLNSPVVERNLRVDTSAKETIVDVVAEKNIEVKNLIKDFETATQFNGLVKKIDINSFIFKLKSLL